ncbi:metallophosphoesterase [Chryseolinea lacunae]|uniref:Metallophosphoesterase n=1 Tax=Chryseolinea lacunae TaxID=2801331 RepID=A0ABS1KXT8_9BACT|nr:metallophosphoesterase [Chryseolinea lacunae]MBL0744280.1 metallophosphoesterase [Chryseolinea lacunae]
MIRHLLSFLLLLSPSLLCAATVSGYVFVDKNINGVRDKNEAGVGGVAVSDQVQVVQTDGSGRYTLNGVQGYGLVFVSVPTGFKTVGAYWQNIPAGNEEVNFGLAVAPAPATFTFVHASDTHISPASLPRTERLRAMADSLRPAFVLVSGDLVKDALRVPEKEASDLYALYVQEVKKFSMPVWSAAGNHENFGIERHQSLVGKTNPLYGKKMFHHYLGPNYYSFNFGGIHFVALDDVDFEDLWYYGHVDSVQVAWLKRDLAAVPANQPVVTFAHMPFFSGGLSLSNFEEEGPGRSLERQQGKLHYRHVVSNAQELVGILSGHPYPLSLAGHFHFRQVFTFESYGQPTRYEQTAAVVGPAQEGSIQMPSGITVYTVKGGVIGEGKFVRLDVK